MTVKLLSEAMQRVEAWPEAVQEELASIALEIDAELAAGDYRATRGELAGIDRGIQSADSGRFASPEDVAAIFDKHRPA